MLVAALIFVISIAAVVQFAVLSWHAALLKTAAEPLPADWASTADAITKSFSTSGFQNISAYSKLCPDLGGPAPKFRALRAYYGFLRLLSGLSESFSSGWASREMALCTRCAAVMLSQQLERTQALSAAARSF